MTERERFQNTFSHLQAPPALLEEVLRRAEKPVRKRRAPRRIAALALAAALLLALGVTAYALGRSIHQQRQEELRQQLAVEENQVESYLEFTPPEGAAPGLTLLSTFSDGEVQRIFVNVSPVSPEEIRSPWLYQEVQEDGRTHYMAYEFTVNGENRNYARIHVYGDWEYGPEDYVTYIDGYGMEDTSLTYEAKYNRYLAQAYDAESQTLTLECFFWQKDVPAGEPVELHVYSTDNWATADEHNNLSPYPTTALHRDFGTVRVPLVQADTRTVYFEKPVAFENSVTHGNARIFGAEFGATGLAWLVDRADWIRDYPTGAAEGDPARYEIDAAWMQAMDELLQDARLELSDGGQVFCPGSAGFIEEEGAIRVMTEWLLGGTVNVQEVAAITVAGHSFPVPQE